MIQNKKPIIWGIIPARFASTRFPGKPLVLFRGRPLIEWVYKRALATKRFDRVVVATDDGRIFQHIHQIGGDAVMTSSTHRSGTDRCGEVIQKVPKVDIVVNIQGDEPLIPTEHFDALLAALERSPIATLVQPIQQAAELSNPNVVKVVTNANKQALYFSRAPIPYCREGDLDNWMTEGTFLRHIGLYGFHKKTLETLVQLPVSSLEQIEKLEQLRWLEHGFPISVGMVRTSSFGIDTPEDLEKLSQMVEKGTIQLEIE